MVSLTLTHKSLMEVQEKKELEVGHFNPVEYESSIFIFHAARWGSLFTGGNDG